LWFPVYLDISVEKNEITRSSKLVTFFIVILQYIAGNHKFNNIKFTVILLMYLVTIINNEFCVHITVLPDICEHKLIY